MNSNISFLSKPTKYFIIFSGLIFLAVILLNDGFMALDEYWVGITRYIPAQNSSVQTLVAPDDVKSPLQILPMHGVAQLAHQLGVESPYGQYRIVIFVLGLINFLVLIYALLKLAGALKLDTKQRNFLILMFTLYFATPFGLTRPMFESIAAPWLTLSAVLALRYDLYDQLEDLIWGVVFVSVAFILRQQLGFCALTFIVLPILKEKWKHLFVAAGVGLGLLIFAGIPDYFLRGQFHYSLLNLTIYNYQHGSEYGNKPITFYPILIFAMCFTPFFLKRYPAQFVKDHFKAARSLWMMVVLFVFLHSLFPQKWERFIISLIPILIIIVFPFLYHLQQNFKLHRARLISLYSINGILFLIASFFPPQKNLIEMSRYLAKHPEIKTIHRINDTPGWITEAFILNKQFQFTESSKELLAQVNWSDCSQAFVIGEFDLPQYQELTKGLQQIGEFKVNLIEQVAYRLNPKNNQRRVKLHLYSGCQLPNS
jgi:Alg9-like mannosyltransferase family